MKYGHVFEIGELKVDMYALEFVNGVPTKFQVFINGHFEGFIYYSDKWEFELTRLASGKLNEETAQEIRNYLIELHKKSGSAF